MRRVLLILAFILSTTAAVVHAFTDEEHRHLARKTFDPIRRLDISITPEMLAEITARSSHDDLSPARFHVRGRTALEQAAVIAPDRLDDIVSSVIENPPTENAFGPYANNVVANYLVYHTLALHCAGKAYDEAIDVLPKRTFPQSEWTEHALIFEAVAQGYLADAFSSSHLLTPYHVALASLQGANIRAAHEFFATQGAYVYANGDVWQTFGDGLLHWYSPAYDHVLAACHESFSAVARATRFGHPETTDAAARGFVRFIPVVVTAAWREHSNPEQSPRFYPRFREDALIDPDLHADRRFLYGRDAFYPSAALFGETQNPVDVVRHITTVSAVEYHQTLDFPPAYAGLLLMTGGGALVGDDGGGGVGSVAAGYAWQTRMPLLSQLRASLELEYLYRLGNSDRRVIVPRYALGLGSPVVPGIEAVHFEVGYAWGLHSPYRDQGVKWGVGIGTKPLRFPFTYAGVSARIKYERFWMDEGLDGFQLQLIFR